MGDHGASGSIAARAKALLNTGEISRACELMIGHMQRSPADAVVGEMLAQVLMNTGRTEEAIGWAQRTALAAPTAPGPWRALGWALVQTNRHGEAIDAFLQLAKAQPELEVYLTVLRMLRGRADHDRTIEVVGEALQLFPGHPSLTLCLGSLLADIGQADESVPVLQEGLPKAPDEPVLLQAIAMKLNYCSTFPRDIADAHRAVGAAIESRVRRSGSARSFDTHDRDPGRRIRVGYMSPDFRRHSVAFFLEPVIAYSDRSRFDVFCYFTSPHADQETERFRRMEVTWCNAASMDDATLAERIRTDKIDILVDLAGLTAHDRLNVLAMKPAPIQVTYLGYPASLGLGAVDYRVVDGVTDPPEADGWSVEKLWRLPRCFLAFTPPDGAPDPVRSGPGVVFGSFNNITKVSWATVRLWSEVLKAVPESRLVLKSKALGSRIARESTLDRFEKAGIAADRLDLHPFDAGLNEHLAAYSGIDIALDTAPYCGTTTTCEALWMGVPVVTLRGAMHAGRVGASLLEAAGLRDLVAANPVEYVQIAAALAANSTRRASLRRGLRHQMQQSPLCDGRGLSAAIDAAHNEMWIRWCGATA